MWLRKLKRLQAYDEIQASDQNNVADTAEWATKLKAQPPLAIIATAAGPLIRLAGPLFGVYVGVANGTITARVTTTPGTGSFFPQTWNGTALAALSSISLPCYSISSTTGGIPTGTYMVLLKIYGQYWVISVDCGN